MAKDKKHAFDLHSQKGVADLLAQVRSSAMPAATKTTIRELVLKYAQRGGDAGVREELEVMLEGIDFNGGTGETDSKLVPAEEPAELEEAPAKSSLARRFFGGRPVPTFAPVSVQQKEAKEASEKNDAPAPEPKVMVVETAPTTESVLVEKQPEPAPAPVAKSEETEEVASVPEPVAEEQKTEPEPAPEPKAAPEPVPEPAPAPTNDNLARIQEIKREVIALVGNPVNLVNTNNEIGREYMSALLDAMKKNNAGTRAQSSEAMERLEAAFASVQRVVAVDATPDPASVVEEQKPAPEPVVKEPKSEQAVATDPEPEEDSKPAVETSVDSKIQEIETEVIAEEPTLGGAPLKDIPAHGFSKPPEPAARPEKEPSMPKVPPPPPLGEPERKEEVVSQPVLAAEEKKSESESEPVPTLESIDKSETVKGPEEAISVSTPSPKAHTLTGEDGSLMAPEITVGLEQLLSEWKIFKSSGLFGMGPSGIDHPLYLAIKDSSMLSVDKGNFNGVTEDIQRSITDYLNGWRYEQGIVYQHTETFEHFLRRVVKRILDKTKKA